MRKHSSIAPDWWDYTTLEGEILRDASRLSPADLAQLSRPGFTVRIYDSLDDFYLAEAQEYIDAWKQSTPGRPVGICGPIGPTEQLPLVARLVDSLGLNLGRLGAHFWGMDEWVVDGKPMDPANPLSFAKADMELCFNRISTGLRMPPENIHFPGTDTAKYSATYDSVRCAVMQGGQGEVKHWAFNDPPRRIGQWKNEPPPPAEYRKLATRIVDLHPLTLIQNARTSGGGNITLVPPQALSVGPVETWKSGRVSIWHAGTHDNPFGQRLTALMISKRVPDSAVPMSLLADHPEVTFSYFRGGLGTCEVEMH